MGCIAKGIFLFIIASLRQARADDCRCQDIKATLTSQTRLNNKGFHKDLAITVYGTWKGSSPVSCRILVAILLPHSAFIDPYQVDSQVHENFEVLIPQDVELELPAEKSISHKVWWFLPISQSSLINITLELPVNIRYHQPNEDGSIAFDFPPPLAFTRNCTADKQAVLAACDVTNSSICVWAEQPLASQGPVTVTVPVGYEHHSQIVVAVTAITSILGTLILSYVILKVSTNKPKVT